MSSLATKTVTNLTKSDFAALDRDKRQTIGIFSIDAAQPFNSRTSRARII
jgi:hypothetical protein